MTDLTCWQPVNAERRWPKMYQKGTRENVLEVFSGGFSLTMEF
jgi:hypothetical protein